MSASAPELARATGAIPVAASAPRAGVARASATVVLTLLVVGLGARAVHAYLPTMVVALWAVGAIAVQRRPGARAAIAVFVGAAALIWVNPIFSLYFFAMLGALVVVRRRALGFAAVIVTGALLWPKLAFGRHYHQPGYWNWINEPSLAMAVFVSALIWRERADARRDGRAGAGWSDDPLAFLLAYLFPSHATNPMVFGAKLLATPDEDGAERAERAETNPSGAIRLLPAFVAKVAFLAAIQSAGPGVLLRSLTVTAARDLSWVAGWGIVAASYVETYLALAVAADIPVLVARLYGWVLPAPFRAPLLAASPTELWRRWGIYNRRLLLATVYFPLGGSRTHRYRNVVLTFVASALLLHSGWFGSKYWQVGQAGWRDETIYFVLQSLAVCGALMVRDRFARLRPAVEGGSWRFVLRPLAILATQSYSALVHVVVLAQAMDLGSRFRLIARCLGAARAFAVGGGSP